MASYNLKFNSDDSVIRHTIIGLLADLNNKIYFYRQLEANKRVSIDVPFYYSISGDDQFLRDNFLFSTPSGPDCHPDVAFADGNYDVVPRGVVRLTGMSIDAGKLINKRNIGSYTRMNSEGAMEGYTAEFEMIPIVLSFDIEILVSSTLDALKLTESMIKTLYKSNNFNVEVGHLEEATYRLNSYYQIPEDFEIQTPIDFTWEDKDNYKISFPIQVDSFIPSFDWGNTPFAYGDSDSSNGEGGSSSGGSSSGGTVRRGTERHAGNRMFEIVSSNIAGSLVNPAIESSSVTEDSITGTQINKVFSPDASFNQSEIPQIPVGTNNVLSLNALENPGLFLIPNGAYNQERIVLSTAGSVTIDPSNFVGATYIEISEGGVINIKFYEGGWYITGSSNTTINY